MRKTLLLRKISLILPVLFFAAAAAAALLSFSAAPAAVSAADDGVQTEAPAEGTEQTNDGADDDKGSIALAAGIAIGLAALGGAIGMGVAVAKSNESIARQPEMKNDIRSSMMLGMVFIETAIIYALVVAILLIFVL